MYSCTWRQLYFSTSRSAFLSFEPGEIIWVEWKCDLAPVIRSDLVIVVEVRANNMTNINVKNEPSYHLSWI